MMIHAYNELYLNDAMNNLSSALDYAINVCGIEPDLFSEIFVLSNFLSQFECGNPSVISGMSGVELVRRILSDVCLNESFKEPLYTKSRTEEYWAGWALAQYQWYSAKRFKDIFTSIPLSEIIAMYSVYHEMDISHFIESMDKKYNERKCETKLHKIREARQISQSKLAEISGVNLRSIQLYEQRVNGIDKAQAHTLYKLSRVLGCTIEDLLESPEQQ